MKKFFLVFCLFGAQAMACPAEQICAGDRVVIQNKLLNIQAAKEGSTVSVVKEIFENGTANVSPVGYLTIGDATIVSLQDMSKSAKCAGSLCVGDRAVVQDPCGARGCQSGDVGAAQVVEAFQNGMIRIRADGYFGLVVMPSSQASKAVQCLNNICVNDRVLYKARLCAANVSRCGEIQVAGTVKEVYENGLLRVRRDFGLRQMKITTELVSISGVTKSAQR